MSRGTIAAVASATIVAAAGSAFATFLIISEVNHAFDKYFGGRPLPRHLFAPEQRVDNTVSVDTGTADIRQRPFATITDYKPGSR